MHENESDLYKTVASSIKTDLMSGNEINASLALATIGSLAPEELVI